MANWVQNRILHSIHVVRCWCETVAQSTTIIKRVDLLSSYHTVPVARHGVSPMIRKPMMKLTFYYHSWLWCIATVGVLVTCHLGWSQATPVGSITALSGFKVELLRSARDGEDSWISMAFDDQGRLIVGLDRRGVARLSLNSDQDDIPFERINDSLRHCRGVLHAHASLYVCATDSNGFYRLRDTTGDDRYDDLQLLKAMDYRSRYGHGTNQAILGPDQMIYIVNGNDVAFPEGISPNSPYRDPRNDWLVPNRHDLGEDNRVGHILRTDAEGKTWEVIAGGFRNPFDIAFDRNGELFTYDADMEWDAGLPWYRPTRLNHVVSGGEYGWRWGTGKWPAYYPDSLPTTLDTGFGSPTGIVFGADSRFPARFRQALFMADWQNGRIYSVHLTPVGTSYECEYELFLEGGPLNVCDLAWGPDGWLYFITGGRGSQSGLYRVRYVEPPVRHETGTATDRQDRNAALRQLRHRIERYHTCQSADAVAAVWPYLGSDDVWLRFAARIAIERQDVTQWRDIALRETNRLRQVTALLALARVGQSHDQPKLLDALHHISLNDIAHDELLTVLRVYAISFIRQGRPPAATTKNIAKRLEQLYPHSVSIINQELCELLVYLESPSIVASTMHLIERAPSQEEQICYASLLSQIRFGWDVMLRRRFMAWLSDTHSFSGGKLVADTVRHIHDDFLNGLTIAEREQLAADIDRLTENRNDSATTTTTAENGKEWTIDELLPKLPRVARGRSYESARRALAVASCLRCHSIGSEGGQIGPNLTYVGRRYDARAILESIVRPSLVIDPKYRHTTYYLADGTIVEGRPVGVQADQLEIEIDALTGMTRTIRRDAIEESSPSVISPMPEHLLAPLTVDEILDLIAYLQSGGDPDHPAFQPVE